MGCVVHTHSPYATAFAVANRPIDCWIEALAMFGLPDGVPVATYGPRGSDEAVSNIRRAVRPGVPAVLLANHGVLVFHRPPDLAILIGGVVEEAAQAAINAMALGGPVEIPSDLRAAALQRAMAFDTVGTRTACQGEADVFGRQPLVPPFWLKSGRSPKSPTSSGSAEPPAPRSTLSKTSVDIHLGPEPQGRLSACG